MNLTMRLPHPLFVGEAGRILRVHSEAFAPSAVNV